MAGPCSKISQSTVRPFEDGETSRASDTILGMTLAMLAVVLFAWLLSRLFGLG
ncbi:hypothetical protein HED49_18220 [Ochrobactrum daejeonense]|nr:hypothetical protein [Brucella daejeonensis]